MDRPAPTLAAARAISATFATPFILLQDKEKWELNFILNGSMYCPIPVDPFLDKMSFLVMEATI